MCLPCMCTCICDCGATSDGEHSMMRALHENNMECPLPVLNIQGSEKSLEKLDDGMSVIQWSYN